MKMVFAILCLFSTIFSAVAQEVPLQFEGLFAHFQPDMRTIHLFLPYNPTIVEIGAYEGNTTKDFAQAYPFGRIIAFEPNERAFKAFLQNTASFKNVTGVNVAIAYHNGKTTLFLRDCIDGNNAEPEKCSSLIGKGEKEPSAEVYCVLLDDWCVVNSVPQVDLLLIDIEGFELQALHASFNVLNEVSAVLVKTHLENGTYDYGQIRAFLEYRGFEFLAHSYRPGLQGDALFIKKNIYDSIFR